MFRSSGAEMGKAKLLMLIPAAIVVVWIISHFFFSRVAVKFDEKSLSSTLAFGTHMILLEPDVSATSGPTIDFENVNYLKETGNHSLLGSLAGRAPTFQADAFGPGLSFLIYYVPFWLYFAISVAAVLACVSWGRLRRRRSGSIPSRVD